MNSANSNSFGRPFSVVLSILSIVVLLISLYFFNVGWDQYVGDKFVDNMRDNGFKLPETSDSQWLIWLFALPLLAQFVGIVCLFPRVHRDKKLITFYGFCLFIMSLCPLSYCWLWTKYTGDSYNQEFYSTLALTFTVLLLLPVAMMTYAIMWKRKNLTSHKWKLKEADIRNWPAFFSQLKNNNGSLADLRRRILSLLSQPLRGEIMHGQDDFANVSKTDLVAEVNRILKRRDLHLAIDLDKDVDGEIKELLQRSQKQLSTEDIERLNALLFMACWPREIESGPMAQDQSKRFTRRVYRSWENYLRNLRIGAEAVQFWVLVFFFSLFLGITYLFGFAFAFHDKATIKEKGVPALEMSKPAASARSLAEGSNPKAADDEGPRFSYVFYFNSRSAVPQYKYSPFDPMAYERTPLGLARRNEDWRHRKNVEHFEKLAKSIIANTDTNEGLRIELRGAADDSVLKEGTTYSSNYALSEARAQNVKYILLGKLTEKDKRERKIEWLPLPLSSESSLNPPIPQTQGEEAERFRQNRMKRLIRRAKLPPNERRQQEAAEFQEEKQGRKFKLLQGEKLSKDHERFLEHKIDEIYEYSRERGLSIEESQALFDKLDDLAQIMRDARKKDSPEKQRMLMDSLAQKREELDESLQALEYVEKDAAKRVVSASLISVKNNERFIPLALLDYMYFTNYTITTTGYGDIVPTTPFAKFLCSMANILEVFFFVVFFNALLSVKGEKET
jgi:ion channel